YASPLARAFQTAEILAKEEKLPLRRLTGLRERDFGYWEGKSWQQVEAKYPDEFHLWREQPMVGIPSGGESRKSCEARSERAIRQILEETAGDAVIVAHGGILVFLMNYLLRFHREPQEIIVANASLSVVSYDRSTGMGKLLALNETGTLEQ
ncbi:histidine phosphatase family protein, partial [Clostridium sp. CAG:43]